MTGDPTLVLYGIPNCDTIRKARKWLQAHAHDYTFHDYRKDGITEQQIQLWCDQLGWDKLLNKRGTTWRKLDASVKDSIDESSAVQLMQQYPAMIKRPLLVTQKNYLLGFNPDQYADLLNV